VNKKSKLFYLVFLLIILTAFIILTGYINHIYRFNSNTSVTAEKGTLDLTPLNLAESLTTLDGEWEFYWMELLEPSDFNKIDNGEFNERDVKKNFINTPKAWNGYQLDEQTLTGDGFATYRLNVKTNDTARLLGLKLPRVLTSHRVWINGELLASAGTVGTNLGEMAPQYLPQTLFFEPNPNQTEIIIQVSNFCHRSGGILESISVGGADQINALRNKNVAAELFIFGGLLSMGLYQLALFLFRRKEFASLYFGLFSILVAIRTLMVGEIFFVNLFPNINWEMAHNIQTISYYLGVPMFFMFLKAMFPEEVSTKVLRIIQGIGVAFSLLVLLTPARIFTNYNTIYQGFTVILLIYLFYVLCIIIAKQKTGANLIAVGALALFITTLHDLIYLSTWMSDQANYMVSNYITRGNLSSYGQLVFVFFHSLVLGKRFSLALIKEEEFSSYQKKVNEYLEKLVQKRTKALEDSYEKIKQQSLDLEEANKALQQLSQRDSLTGLYNRRHFDYILDLEWRRASRNQSPISLIFIDIDYFKSYNDYYGHQAGDACLKKIAEVLINSLSRASDFVSRFGGEEFTVILSNTSKADALRTAEYLRENIEMLKIEHFDSPLSQYVTASFGFSTLIPDDNLSTKDLIHHADKALYLAKKEGRNKVSFLNNTFNKDIY